MPMPFVVGSVWQVLTLIFVISALTKLVYRLIREEEEEPQDHHRQQQHPTIRGRNATGEPQREGGQDIERSDRSISQPQQNGRDSALVFDLNEQTGSSEEHANSSSKSNSSRNSTIDSDSDSNESWSSLNRAQVNYLAHRNENELLKYKTNSSSNNDSNKSQHQHSNRQQSFASNLSLATSGILLILLEPAKFLIGASRGSLKLICLLLDSIEGIEHQWEEEERAEVEAEATGAARSVAAKGANGRPKAPEALEGACRPAAKSGAPLGAKSLAQAEGSATAAAANRQTSTTQKSNYFFRRYLSRRSLSEALLDDEPDPYEDLEEQEEKQD